MTLAWITLTVLQETHMLKGGLLWLIGIPIPVILVLWFLGVFH